MAVGLVKLIFYPLPRLVRCRPETDSEAPRTIGKLTSERCSEEVAKDFAFVDRKLEIISV